MFRPFLRPAVLLTILLLSGGNVARASSEFCRFSLPGTDHKACPREPYQQDKRYRLASPAVSRASDTRPYAQEITLAARESSLDAELIHAVIAVESAYQASAISPKGAIGLMQVLPETAQLYGVRSARETAEVPTNLRAGSLHLSRLLRDFDHRLDLALAAYNAGEGVVKRYGKIPPYPETQQYVPAVIARYRENSIQAGTQNPTKPVFKDYLPGTRLAWQKTAPALY